MKWYDKQMMFFDLLTCRPDSSLTSSLAGELLNFEGTYPPPILEYIVPFRSESEPREIGSQKTQSLFQNLNPMVEGSGRNLPGAFTTARWYWGIINWVRMLKITNIMSMKIMIMIMMLGDDFFCWQEQEKKYQLSLEQNMYFYLFIFVHVPVFDINYTCICICMVGRRRENKTSWVLSKNRAVYLPLSLGRSHPPLFSSWQIQICILDDNLHFSR